MPYEPFYEKFGELAWKETRSITISGHPKLPADDYGLIEAIATMKTVTASECFSKSFPGSVMVLSQLLPMGGKPRVSMPNSSGQMTL